MCSREKWLYSEHRYSRIPVSSMLEIGCGPAPHVDVNGATELLRETWIRRVIYPQEFLMLIEHRPDFEFAGWWNRWDLTQPLDGNPEPSRPITLVRKI